MSIDKTPEQLAKEAADAQAQANAGLASGGSGYRFDPEFADELINDMRDLLDWLQTDPQSAADSLRYLGEPLGDEMGSGNYAQDLRDFGTGYNKYLASVITEVKRQIEVLTEAKQKYLEHEQQVTDTLKGRHPDDA